MPAPSSISPRSCRTRRVSAIPRAFSNAISALTRVIRRTDRADPGNDALHVEIVLADQELFVVPTALVDVHIDIDDAIARDLDEDAAVALHPTEMRDRDRSASRHALPPPSRPIRIHAGAEKCRMRVEISIAEIPRSANMVTLAS